MTGFEFLCHMNEFNSLAELAWTGIDQTGSPVRNPATQAQPQVLPPLIGTPPSASVWAMGPTLRQYLHKPVLCLYVYPRSRQTSIVLSVQRQLLDGSQITKPHT